MFLNRHIASLLQTGAGNARKLSLKFLGSDEAVGLQDGRAREFSRADLWRVYLGAELMGLGFSLNTAAGTLNMVWAEVERYGLMPGATPSSVCELRIYQQRRTGPDLGGPEGVPFFRFVISRRQIRNALRLPATGDLPFGAAPLIEEMYQDDPAVMSDKFRRSVCICLNLSEILTEFEFDLRKLELSEF